MRCSYLKPDGSQCGQRVPTDASLCLWHDPARSDEADKLRRVGGKNSKPPRWKGRVVVLPEDAPAPPETVADAKAYASWAVHAVTTGQLDPDSGRVVCSLLKEFIVATQKSDHERELSDLRRQLAELRGRG